MVTEADREAKKAARKQAADYLRAIKAITGREHDEIMRGKWDDREQVAWFLRHRTASTAALTAEMEEWRLHAGDLACTINDLQKVADALEAENQRLRRAIKLTVGDAAYHLRKYRPHCLEALEAALSTPSEVSELGKSGAGPAWEDTDRWLSTPDEELRSEPDPDEVAGTYSAFKVSEPVADHIGGEGREKLKGLELSEDGLSLRWPYDGDVDGDGRWITVGGNAVITFEDSDDGEAARELFLSALATPPNPTNGDAVREALEKAAEAFEEHAAFAQDQREAGDELGSSVWSMALDAINTEARCNAKMVREALATLAKHGGAEA